MIIVSVLLKILLALICILIALILIPFEYNLNSQVNADIHFEGKIFWLFRIIKVAFLKEEAGFKIKFFILGKGIFSVKPVKNLKHKKKKPNKQSNKKFLQRNFINCVISYFIDILEIIKPKEIYIKGFYGFYDPSVTGFLSGVIPIIKQIIPSCDIELQPIFDDEVVQIKANVYGKITLIFLVYKTIKFILKKEVRKILFKKPKTIET